MFPSRPNQLRLRRAGSQLAMFAGGALAAFQSLDTKRELEAPPWGAYALCAFGLALHPGRLGEADVPVDLQRSLTHAMWTDFRRNSPGVIGLSVGLFIFALALPDQLFAPLGAEQRSTRLTLLMAGGAGPFHQLARRATFAALRSQNTRPGRLRASHWFHIDECIGSALLDLSGGLLDSCLLILVCLPSSGAGLFHAFHSFLLCIHVMWRHGIMLLTERENITSEWESAGRLFFAGCVWIMHSSLDIVFLGEGSPYRYLGFTSLGIAGPIDGATTLLGIMLYTPLSISRYPIRLGPFGSQVPNRLPAVMPVLDLHHLPPQLARLLGAGDLQVGIQLFYRLNRMHLWDGQQFNLPPIPRAVFPAPRPLALLPFRHRQRFGGRIDALPAHAPAPARHV